MGKQHRKETGKKRYPKIIVTTINEMKTTTLYIGLRDKNTYRRSGDGLEVLEAGNWKPVKLTAEFLQELRLREY